MPEGVVVVFLIVSLQFLLQPSFFTVLLLVLVGKAVPFSLSLSTYSSSSSSKPSIFHPILDPFVVIPMPPLHYHQNPQQRQHQGQHHETLLPVRRRSLRLYNNALQNSHSSENDDLNDDGIVFRQNHPQNKKNDDNRKTRKKKRKSQDDDNDDDVFVEKESSSSSSSLLSRKGIKPEDSSSNTTNPPPPSSSSFSKRSRRNNQSSTKVVVAAPAGPTTSSFSSSSSSSSERRRTRSCTATTTTSPPPTTTKTNPSRSRTNNKSKLSTTTTTATTTTRNTNKTKETLTVTETTTNATAIAIGVETPSTSATTTTTMKKKKNPSTTTKVVSSSSSSSSCLPRTIEERRLREYPSLRYVMGIDEAGRGPLAGPVVTAAIWVPPPSTITTTTTYNTNIDGIVDSKQISSELERERLYEELIQIPQIQWAIAIIDPSTIDKINILQATMIGMKYCAIAMVTMRDNSNNNSDNNNKQVDSTIDHPTSVDDIHKEKNDDDESADVAKESPNEETNDLFSLPVPIHSFASIEHQGCYVVTSSSSSSSSQQSQQRTQPPIMTCDDTETKGDENSVPNSIHHNDDNYDYYYALIDGNRIPKDMPCGAEFVIKGDGKEYMIAAASILAKVTRDRLMNEYDRFYPEYQFRKHKGYPTAEHRATIARLGATPIHRRTFAPLKHMTFDENGQIINVTK